MKLKQQIQYVCRVGKIVRSRQKETYKMPESLPVSNTEEERI